MDRPVRQRDRGGLEMGGQHKAHKWVCTVCNPFNNLNMTRTTLTQNISVAQILFSPLFVRSFWLFVFCLISLPLCDFNSILPVICSFPLPPFPYSFWKQFSLEPDNNISGGVEGEDCVVMESNTHAWSDVPCDFTYRRICQMDAIPITSPWISGWTTPLTMKLT